MWSILLFIVGGLCAPLLKRQQVVLPAGPLPLTETDTLNLALYLEHIEYTLYTQGYNNYSLAQYEAAGLTETFRNRVLEVAEQEAVHIATLTAVLEAVGVTPIANCSYKFPATTVQEFIAVANAITSVGIGAYIGGSVNLKATDELLLAAASILSNENRHDAYLRADGADLDPFPSAFDTGLVATWAYNLAQPFIVECPAQLTMNGSAVPVLPALSIVNPVPSYDTNPVGSMVEFEFDASTVPSAVSGTQLYLAFVNQIFEPIFVEAIVGGTGVQTFSVAIPAGLENVAYAVLTSYSGGLNSTELQMYGSLTAPVEIVVS